MEGVFICIGCKRRKRIHEAVFSDKYLGICKNCNEKLSYFPEKTVFQGTDSIDSCISTFHYEGLIKEIIRRYKFEGQFGYGDTLAKMMIKTLSDFPLAQDYDFLTAIPISRKRFYERGYNQAEYLAKSIADVLDFETNFQCIFKSRHNKRQSLTKNKIERRENVKDVYIADYRKIEGKRIILIDDVYTTGSTIEECAKELREKGAKSILGVTLARKFRYGKDIFGK